MNEISNKNIENLIYEIRGKQVMLDSDLARLYECSNGTKDINKAVKRNINKFPNDFYFELTTDECLRFQNGTLNSKGNLRGQHVKYLPHAFTEQGVAMLSSVLKTEVAARVSVSIMRAFVAMRHYIGNNEYRLSNVESKLIEHDSSIKLLQESFNKFDEKKKINEIYFNGQIFDAYSKILDILKEAKKELIIIDNYADNYLLDIIKKLDVRVILITTNKYFTNEMVDRYNKQYSNLKVIFNNTFHDRYFILDNKTIYHCGASINRIGYKTFSINLINDEEVCNLLLNKIKRIE